MVAGVYAVRVSREKYVHRISSVNWRDVSRLVVKTSVDLMAAVVCVESALGTLFVWMGSAWIPLMAAVL